MTLPAEDLATRVRQRFADRVAHCVVALGQVAVELAPERLRDVCYALRDEPEFSFEQLIDVCGVDYSSYGAAEWLTNEASTAGFSRGVSDATAQRTDRPRYAVVYHLLSLRHNQRLRLRVYAPGDPPCVPSVIEIWRSADWFEREAFDLFGVLFDGHPDLRRLLTDYGFIGHPFRKDFPLEGNVEVRYDPDQGRVVYQPVTIENRVLVPRVIRPDYPLPRAAADKGAKA
ncbi:MAG: NADH-quinone oxidoreductase subunit C [Gammaproteobacteria bacterium]